MADEIEWILAGTRISADDAAKLEANLATNPDDLRARLQLLGYFSAGTPYDERRYKHALWCIANHPELDLAPFNEIFEPFAPEAYAEAKRLWQAAIEKQPTNATILRRASDFFTFYDPTLAENLLRRGASLEPEVVHWREALAHLHMLQAGRADSESVRAELGRDALREYDSAQLLETSPDGKYGLLIEAAQAALMAKDYERATAYAERVLREAKDFEGTSTCGNGIHYGHIVLGRVALARDDVAGAKRHLSAAAAPGSPQLDSPGPDQELAVELLARGERDTVIAYAEACKRLYGRGLGMIGAAYRGREPFLAVVREPD